LNGPAWTVWAAISIAAPLAKATLADLKPCMAPRMRWEWGGFWTRLRGEIADPQGMY
jgi:hypothetical protein